MLSRLTRNYTVCKFDYFPFSALNAKAKTVRAEKVTNPSVSGVGAPDSHHCSPSMPWIPFPFVGLT